MWCVLIICSSEIFLFFSLTSQPPSNLQVTYIRLSKKTVYEYIYVYIQKKHMKIHRQCNTRRQPYGLHFSAKKICYTPAALIYRLSAVWLYTKFTHIKNISHMSRKSTIFWFYNVVDGWLFRATTFTYNIFVWQRCLARPNTSEKQQQYQRVGKWFRCSFVGL